MGLLTTLFGKSSLTPGPANDYWYQPVSTPTSSGVGVDETTALNYSAVWAATRIIAETCASLPCILYQRLQPRGKERAHGHQLYALLKNRPNPDMDAFTFWEGRIAHAVNWGNGFGEIERSIGGKPIALWPIHPSRVKPPERNKNGQLIYKVRRDNGMDREVVSTNLFHIVGPLSEDGLWGQSVIGHARESIGMGMATEQYGASFFGNGARPGGVLEHPSRLSEPAQKNLRESWQAMHGGPRNAMKVAILQEGMKFNSIDIPPEQAQFLGTRQFNILEIARWYRLPPHLLGDLTRQGYNSLEQENLSLVVHSLRPWLVRTEQAIGRQLLTDKELESYFVEFLLDALLRGDTPTRTQALMTQWLNGALTTNEWREIENRNPVEGGDRLFVPLNLGLLDQAGMQPGEPEENAAAGDSGEVLDVPDHRQTTDYTCGCVATQCVADYHGVGEGRTEMDYAAELGATREGGTAPEAMIEWFNEHGLTCTSGSGWTVEHLAAFFKAGQPVICPVQMYGMTPEYDAEEVKNQTGHYVVVIGVGLGVVIFHDPSAGRQVLPVEEFDKIWHDVEADGSISDHFGIACGEGPMGVSDEDEDEEETEPEPEPETEDKPADKPADGGTDGAMSSNRIQSYFSANGNGSHSVATLNATAVERAKKLLDATVVRMLRIEANEARRAAKKPQEFLTKLDTFYDDYPETLRDAFAPVIAVYLTVTGDSRDVEEVTDDLIERHIMESREALLLAAEVPAEQLAGSIERCVKEWESRRINLQGTEQ